MSDIVKFKIASFVLRWSAIFFNYVCDTITVTQRLYVTYSSLSLSVMVKSIHAAMTYDELMHDHAWKQQKFSRSEIVELVSEKGTRLSFGLNTLQLFIIDILIIVIKVFNKIWFDLTWFIYWVVCHHTTSSLFVFSRNMTTSFTCNC